MIVRRSLNTKVGIKSFEILEHIEGRGSMRIKTSILFRVKCILNFLCNCVVVNRCTNSACGRPRKLQDRAQDGTDLDRDWTSLLLIHQ